MNCYFIEDAVKYLLGTRSESTDIANYDGRTCLHIAALTNNLPLVSYLVDNNASKKSVMTCGVREKYMRKYIYALYNPPVMHIYNNHLKENAFS